MSNKILVIDDEEAIRTAIKDTLELEGYQVETAIDFDAALVALDDFGPELVISDIVLGGKTGVDLLREIKERDLTCLVILITGVPSVDTASEAVRLGAYDYIPKPFKREAILRSVTSALKFKAVSDEKEKYRTNLDLLFRSLKEGILTLDNEMRILEMNRAFEQLYGIDRSKIGLPFYDVLDKRSAKCFSLVENTLKTHEPAEAFRVPCEVPDNAVKIISYKTTPLVDESNRYSGVALIIYDETKIDKLERELKARQGLHNIIGRSRVMQDLFELLEMVSNVESTILLQGETGTGKELFANAIHALSDRANGPLVKVNCAALSENLLESELFGHVKGAFTGAISDKKGRFELANRGTIFLDEIGEISETVQLKLLRVLQEREIERVGDSKTKKIDVRIIAATNKDLKRAINDGKFREDLYYRLKVVEIKIPPLRGRMEDVELLSKHLIGKINSKLGKRVEGLDNRVLELFMRYAWPGNVRELENVIERSMILCDNRYIMIEHLPTDFMESSGDTMPLGRAHKTSSGELAPEDITRALHESKWNKTKAAKLLGISRRHLYNKIEEFNIHD